MNHVPHSHVPGEVLPCFNPEVEVDSSCSVCRSDCPVEYVAVTSNDHMKHPGLALYMQDAACRRFARYRLHRRIDGAFMDMPGTRRTGFKRLLSHLAICHNRLLITSRLDRLSVAQTRKLGGLAVRVVSATSPNTKKRISQAELIPRIQSTIRQMFKTAKKNDKGARS